MGYTRWDPQSRAGAVALRKQSPHDLRAVEALAETLTDWTHYQNLAGECDTVESCPVAGPYDWRSYIREEAQLAERRDQQTKPAKKDADASVKAAPSVFYA